MGVCGRSGLRGLWAVPLNPKVCGCDLAGGETPLWFRPLPIYPRSAPARVLVQPPDMPVRESRLEPWSIHPASSFLTILKHTFQWHCIYLRCRVAITTVLFRNFSIRVPKETPVPPLPSPSPWQPLISMSTDLPVQDISHGHNLTGCGL